ncbi:MAG TPA: glutaredoxin [archaeon]|nr:glutaredoxin [archaeon]
MPIKNYAKKVPGKKKNEILLFTLSTCVWCKKAKKLLNDIGLEYSYIDVDLLDDDVRDEVVKEFVHWNPDESFPTIVINNKKCIKGYQEDELKELGE